MAKHDVTRENILELAAEIVVSPPVEITIKEDIIELEWFGNRTGAAQKLFDAGLGRYWDFDNDSATRELKPIRYDQEAGKTTTAIVRV